MRQLIITLTFTFLLLSCANQSESKKEIKEAPGKIKTVVRVSSDEGLKLLKLHCYACHNPQAPSHDEIIAPPLAGIKNRYKIKYEGREEFINRMSSFLKEPSEEKAVMRGPVKRFGLMPKMPIAENEEEIIKVVTYIYENKLEYPDWLPEHFEEMHGESIGGKE